MPDWLWFVIGLVGNLAIGFYVGYMNGSLDGWSIGYNACLWGFSS